MKRTVTTRLLVAGTLALSAALFAAAPAMADDLVPTTVNGMACQNIDIQAPIGTTVLYSLGEDCNSTDFSILNGSPSVTYTPGSGGPLVWRQEIERAPGAACPEGWGESWADWANGRKGGPTCVTDTVWGQAPRVNPVITVVINTDSDWVEITANQQWANGCGRDLSGDPYRVINYCIV